MNNIFGEELFESELMFMNHSPVRSYLMKYSKLPGIILISGSLNIVEIVDDLNITNYITADELYAIFHQQDEEIRQNNDLAFYKSPF